MQSPFERLLGSAFDRLPASVRRLHTLRQPVVTHGRADIAVAKGPIAWLICWMAGLPRPGTDTPVSVSFAPDGRGGERWTRRFGDRGYAGTLVAGEDRNEGYLIEHLGVFDLRFRLTVRDDGLLWTLDGWRVLGIPMPRWSAPRSECLEGGDGERYTFDIDATFPVVGWLIHYRGWLLPEDAPPQPPAA